VPFISVIITVHNGREFLLEAVNSALNQTLPKEEHETIVVNNFSAYDDIKKTRCEKLYFLIKRIKVPILLTLYPMQKAK